MRLSLAHTEFCIIYMLYTASFGSVCSTYSKSYSIPLLSFLGTLITSVNLIIKSLVLYSLYH